MPRRLDPAVFDLPVDAMRSGRYSDKYFLRTRQVLINDGHRPLVVMQVFSKASAWLCGIDEAIAVLKLVSHDWSALEVHALYDGDAVSPNETVMTIKGPYDVFAELETIYLGILARRTRIHTQTRRVVEAANGKDVLYFPARHDHWSIQEGDGYAAYLAGASGVSTDAQGAWWEAEGVGTIPHALIATYGGDTVLAARKFVEHVRESMNLVVLVDFDNDCVKTSLDVAEALGHRLYGVRLDTPESLVDASLAGGGDADHLWGVNPPLVRNVREALDAHGHEDVRIVVSGGFDVDKIRRFEDETVPVDVYGVGSSLVHNVGGFDFTADIVEVDGRPAAKVGRTLNRNDRLELVS